MLFTASPALADDDQDSGDAPPAVADEPAQVPAPSDAAERVTVATTGFDLRLGRVPLSPAPTPALRPVDLTPAQLWVEPWLSFGDPAELNRPEQRRGIDLPDGDWRVQAAQVGVMAAGFAALVGLCGGGKCLLPNAVNEWLPDWAEAKPPPNVTVRPQPRVRQLR